MKDVMLVKYVLFGVSRVEMCSAANNLLLLQFSMSTDNIMALRHEWKSNNFKKRDIEMIPGFQILALLSSAKLSSDE